MVDLNGHEAGNGGHSQGKPKAYRDSSTRREAILGQEIGSRLSEQHLICGVALEMPNGLPVNLSTVTV
jgi:hypothetical protein